MEGPGPDTEGCVGALAIVFVVAIAITIFWGVLGEVWEGRP